MAVLQPQWCVHRCLDLGKRIQVKHAIAHCWLDGFKLDASGDVIEGSKKVQLADGCVDNCSAQNLTLS
jgi:hypothetical protein